MVMGLAEWLRDHLLPDLEDSAALREWVKRILGWADTAADWSPNETDDKVVEFLRVAVADDEVWQAFYDLIVAALGLDDLIVAALGLDDKGAQVALDALPEMGRLRDKVDPKFNIGIIIMAIQVFVAIISVWRKRDQQ